MLDKQQKHKIQFIKTVLWGLLVITLYSSLYFAETQVIQWTAEGRWTFIIPITIAFVFSFAHGHFTGEFWDLLGIKPKQSGGKS
ncbi:MAG TPA: hypothetical protein DCM38_13885 [Gammaproteobacteria bacterium]|nr:hypothetical protein [Gammaproteobacteria bacterium]